MEIICPKCSQAYDVDDSCLGQNVECTECGNVWTIIVQPPQSIADSKTGYDHLLKKDKYSNTREITCSKCKHTFNENKKEKKAICPRCGNVFDNLSSRQKAMGCLLLFVIIVLFSIVYAIIVDNNPKGHVVGKEMSEAYYFAREFAKDCLKSPASALFPSNPKRSMHLGNDEYEVEFYVDSQNSFSAMIRTNFQIKLRHNNDNDKWYLTDIKFW